jgi:hypothetical protein
MVDASGRLLKLVHVVVVTAAHGILAVCLERPCRMRIAP